MAASDRVPVTGSERAPTPGHTRVGEVHLGADVDVTVYVRPRAPLAWVDAESARAPQGRRLVAREDWADAHGAADADMTAVAHYAQDAGLTVISLDSARRAVRLRGSLRDAAAAFGATMEGRFQTVDGSGEYRARSGALPHSAHRAWGRRHGRVRDRRPAAGPARICAGRRPAGRAPRYTPVQVAEAYDLPLGVTGKGETVGIVELGGGFSTDRPHHLFQGPGPHPAERHRGRGRRRPELARHRSRLRRRGHARHRGRRRRRPRRADRGLLRPQHRPGVHRRVSTAVHDTTHKPSVVSVSWGSPRTRWTAQARTQMEQILTEAGGLGVTVTVAAGDNGSTDGVTDGQQHVDFPASAPHALACGGTTLHASGATIKSETVWNDGRATARRAAASAASSPCPATRPAPACRSTSTRRRPGAASRTCAATPTPRPATSIRVDGADETIGGTSAVAPLWAGSARASTQHLGAPLGFAQPLLYPLLGSGSFHDITSGDNGSYTAGPGWDACTGLGSPDGTALAAASGAGGKRYRRRRVIEALRRRAVAV